MTDVVVVGAGLSGLAAAELLEGSGLEVVVLEARDRVGGRLRTTEVGGTDFDVGGQWVGPDQPRVAALADAVGAPRFPTPTEGRTLFDLGDRRLTAAGTIPRLPVLSLLQLRLALAWTDHRAAGVPAAGLSPARGEERPDRLALPGGDPVAWDRLSVAALMRRRGLRTDVRAVVGPALRVVFGVEPDELSVLQLLQYVRAAGSAAALVDTEGGAQETRFVHGAGDLAGRLAARLGGTVRTGAAVAEVVDDGGRVTATPERGAAVTARAAVVAVPPNLVGGIDFDPALPDDRRRWLAGQRMGATVKCLAVYPRPFWRDAGLSGEAVCADGPLSVVFDNTAADGTACLVGFAVGDHARELGGRSRAARRRAVLGRLRDLFGSPAGEPDAYHDHDWGAERHTGGCPVALPGVGVTAGAGLDPRRPHGRVHWAGTELATVWRGYMEGAVQSGQRAAREVVGQLEGQRA